MNEMYIDDQKIGLHNFKTTSKQGCWGCRNVSVIFFYWVSRHNLSLSELKEFLGVVTCMSLSLCFFIRPAANVEQTGTFHFDGLGYSAKPQVRSYRSTTFYVKMEFKTFWRDAILLFTGNNKTVGGELVIKNEMREHSESSAFHITFKWINVLIDV